jgi:hypothetical protein
MPAHDFAEQSDVRWTIASKNAGDIPEVARAEQTRTDDRKEASVSVAIIGESVDHAARYEECLARIQIGARSAEGKRRDAVQPENGFIELVVAVRRGHACISRNIALEDAHTAPGLVCVDVEADGESPDLDRLGRCIRHEGWLLG